MRLLPAHPTYRPLPRLANFVGYWSLYTLDTLGHGVGLPKGWQERLCQAVERREG